MMKSILYVRLPCRPIYPGGVIALADFIHSRQPEIGQHILDLALIEKGKRKDILAETIKGFSPDIIVFSWRDIQIFSPDENDNALITALRFYYGNIPERIPAALKGLRYILGYREGIKENLLLVHGAVSSYPDKRIVLGGGAVSVFADQLIPLLEPGILCVVGEGEGALLKVVSNKTNEEIAESERVVYKDRDDSIHKGVGWSPLRLEDDEAINFDYIASIFPGFPEYLKGTMGVTTKRGCPHQCIFCLYNYIEGKKVRYRPARVVLKEVESLYFDFGVRDFYFTDSQFIPDREALGQVEAILEGIIGKGLSLNWQGYLRIEAIDQELAR
ncbi:radical SAM protein, partial [bacterium]|nr:radical SAM protein [bacterium]